jgi:hypothetical protein
MRVLFLILGLACWLCVATIAPSPANGQSASMPQIVTKEAFSTDGLHIIGVDSDNDQQLRWATWGNRSKHGMSIVLALLKKTQNGVSILWSREKHHSYEPHLTRLTSWRYGQHPILALTYRYGALAEQVELYGLDAKNQPVKLGEELGEEVEWSINSVGEGLMSVYSNPEGHIVPTCYRWEKKRQRLEKVECK